MWTGVLVGVTNPKTIVFFAAFLPQFIDPGAPAAPQLLLLGAVFGALAVCLRQLLGAGRRQGPGLVRPRAAAPGPARCHRRRDDGRPRRDPGDDRHLDALIDVLIDALTPRSTLP